MKTPSNSDLLFIFKKKGKQTPKQLRWSYNHSCVPDSTSKEESFSSALLLYSKTMLDIFWSSQRIVYHNMTAQYALIFFLAYSVRDLGQKGAGVTSEKHSRLTAVEITILNWAQRPMDRASSAGAGLCIQGCCQHWRMESSAWDA